ncbi:linear gramicidin synthase subunit D-like [Planococcus citri]|uniref:linear gramicidin synthase subunit D-like n=1 Tax=Planococcus citri TaxID=170843 RepID=UPI0031F92D8A
MAKLHNIVNMFENQAVSQSNKAALIFESETITYRQLNEKANQLAKHLIAAGLTRTSVVALCVEQCPNRAIFMLAAWKVGAIIVALDPEYPEAHMISILEDTRSSLLLTSDKLLDKFGNYKGKIIVPESEKHLIADHDAGNLHTIIYPEDNIYIIYTSGSTGKPKGVVVQHGAVFNCLKNYIDTTGISTENTAVQLLTYCFDVVYVEIWAPLLVGATLHLYPNNKIVGAPLLQFLNRYKVDFIPMITPTLLATLPMDESIDNLKAMCIAGEVCPEKVLQHWLSKVEIFNIYGPTETTIGVTCHKYQQGQSARTIGKPLPGVEFYVLDSNMQPLPIGKSGELYISGLQLAQGYLNRADLTAKQFPHVQVGGQMKRLYKTGDIVKLQADGNVEILGRIDDQIKIRGYRVECGEIECAINSIDGVRQAVVVVMNTIKYGRQALSAFVVLNHLQVDQDLEIKKILKKLRDTLPSYMIPSKIKFVNELPCSNTGKVDRKILQAAEREEHITLDGIKSDDIEGIITAIWTNVLQIPNIKPSDDFFCLGGNSFDVMHVAVSLPEHLKRIVTAKDLYLHPTVEKLSGFLREHLYRPSTENEKIETVKNIMFSDIKLETDYEYPTNINPNVLLNPKKILITGVTGFLGSHLLIELLNSTSAHIYCLIRAEDEHDAMDRLKWTITERNRMPWPKHNVDRIIPLVGDFSQQFLKLSQQEYTKLTKEIEIVYHLGANVSYLPPYQILKPTNIDGTQHIIKFATTSKLKYLIACSTVSVFSFAHLFTGKVRTYEDDDLDQNLPGICRDLGYVQSKYVAEKLLEKAIQKGLPVIRFRPGLLLCHSETGVCDEKQWGAMVIKCCLSIGVFPSILDSREQLVTVDFVAKAISCISKDKNAVGKNFSLTPHPVHDITNTGLFNKFNEYFQMNLVPADFQDWLDIWKTDKHNPLFGLVNLFTEPLYKGKCLIELYEQCYYHEIKNTEKFLKGSGIDISSPLITKEVLSNYLDFVQIPH